MEIHAGLKARAVVMVHLLHPMLVMIKDKSCNYKFLDQLPYVRRLQQLVETLRDTPETFLHKDYVAFPGDVFEPVRQPHRRWCEKPNNSLLIDALFSPQTGAQYGVMDTNDADADVEEESDVEDEQSPQSLDDMVMVFLRAYAVKLDERLHKGT